MGLGVVVQGVQQRLERGDVKFDTQGGIQHALELKALAQFSDMRNWMMANFGTKAELAAVVEEVQELRIKAGKFEEKLLAIKAEK